VHVVRLHVLVRPDKAPYRYSPVCLHTRWPVCRSGGLPRNVFRRTVFVMAARSACFRAEIRVATNNSIRVSTADAMANEAGAPASSAVAPGRAPAHARGCVAPPGARARPQCAGLWTAAQRGHLDGVRAALRALAGPHPNLQCADSDSGREGGAVRRSVDSALCIAAANDHAAVVAELLQAKADANAACTLQRLTPLQAAVKWGAMLASSPTLSTLMAAGANANLAVHGRSALYVAARTADVASAALLIGVKACVASAHRSAARHDLSLLEAAVQACECEAEREEAEREEAEWEEAEWEAGGDERAGPPLPGSSALREQAVEFLQLMIRECPWLVRHAPVSAAAKLGHPAVLEALLDAKAAPDGALDHHARFKPLCSAVMHERLRSVRLLASRGARVLHSDLSRSPLHMAFQRGYDAGLRALLPYADVSALRTEPGHTLLHWAAMSNTTATVRVLLEAKAVPEIMSDAVRHAGVLALLLEAKADPNRTSWDGSRLSVAVSVRSIRALRLLVEAKADANAPVAVFGTLPLALAAAQNGSAALVGALLEAKALASAASGLTRHTALHEAVRVGNAPVVKMLLAAGANLHAHDAHGCVAADYAGATDVATRRLLFV
jgi:ankyrin repeat protein